MRRPQLRGFTRRMQRIGQQEESSGELRLLGGEHAALPSAIRMAAKEDSSGRS